MRTGQGVPVVAMKWLAARLGNGGGRLLGSCSRWCWLAHLCCARQPQMGRACGATPRVPRSSGHPATQHPLSPQPPLLLNPCHPPPANPCHPRSITRPPVHAPDPSICPSPEPSVCPSPDPPICPPSLAPGSRAHPAARGGAQAPPARQLAPARCRGRAYSDGAWLAGGSGQRLWRRAVRAAVATAGGRRACRQAGRQLLHAAAAGAAAAAPKKTRGHSLAGGLMVTPSAAACAHRAGPVLCASPNLFLQLSPKLNCTLLPMYLQSRVWLQHGSCAVGQRLARRRGMPLPLRYSCRSTLPV